MIGRISQRRQQGQGGFTLIELLVVIVILGILAAVVVFATQGTGDRGEAAAIKADKETIRTAQEAFCAKNGRYGSAEDLVNGQFLSDFPTLHQVSPTPGGPCLGAGDATRSGFAMPESNPELTIAAAEDTWPREAANGPSKDTTYAYPLNVNVYEPLVYLGSDYSLDPGLAESWQLLPPGKGATCPAGASPSTDPANCSPYPANNTWRFNLRGKTTPAAKWHDWSPTNNHVVTADDVLWTWNQRQRIGKTLSTVANSLGWKAAGNPEDSVQKIDNFTVDFTPRVQNLRLVEQIVHPEGAIVPVGQNFDGSRTNDPTKLGTPGQPIGSGPFRWLSYQANEQVIVERNDDWWGSSKAMTKQLTFNFIKESAQRTAALQSGADLIIDANPLEVSSLESSGFRVVKSAPGRNQLIYMQKIGKTDTTGRTFDLLKDPAIRRAVSLAMDRDKYVQTYFGGNASVGRFMAPPGILGNSANIVPQATFDKGQAQSALEAAGWLCSTSPCPTDALGNNTETRSKNGRSLQLRLIAWAEVAQLGYDTIAAQLRAVGIDVEIPAGVVGNGAKRDELYRGSFFDLDLEVPNQNDGNPAFLPTLRFACKSESTTYRFAPADGTNGVGPAVTDTVSNGGGTFPSGNRPCTIGAPNTSDAVKGPFDSGAPTGDVVANGGWVEAGDRAKTQADAQRAAAEQMRILVGQNESNVVVPVAGVFRIYAMKSNISFSDPHPSQTNQTWVSVSKS